jgi:hypothetical protein
VAGWSLAAGLVSVHVSLRRPATVDGENVGATALTVTPRADHSIASTRVSWFYAALRCAADGVISDANQTRELMLMMRP